MTTKVRLYILALAGTALLTPIGVEARDVSRSALQFGDISYSEVVSSRSGDEPAFVGVPDTDVALSLDIPVPVGRLMIRDSAISLTLGLAGKRCRVFTGIDGYRDLSIGEIGRRLVQLRSGCDWSDAAIANTMAVIESKTGNLQNALAHMRQRAISLLGSDLRCDPHTPPPRPSRQPPVIQMFLDGSPPTPCRDTGSNAIRERSAK